MKTTGAPPKLSGPETDTDVHVSDPNPAGNGSRPLEPAPSDREAFRRCVQQHFHLHAVNDTPFLLIALRGDGPTARPLDFRLLLGCVHPLITEEGKWLVNAQVRRLVVLLPGQGPADARRFFARLKRRLLETAPREAETYLHAISAIVVPNGEAFQNAEDFLTVVLEED